MKISLMQRVDYYAGIPLCFAISLFHKLKTLLLPDNKKNTAIDKILFIELSEMGSAILAYPAIMKAIEMAGRENVYFLIFERNKESIEILNILPEGNIITIESNSFFVFCLSSLKVLAFLRSLKISASLDLELFSRCTAIISYMCGAKYRAGFDNFCEEGLYRGNFLTHRVLYNPFYHMSRNFMALITALQDSSSDIPLLKKQVAAAQIKLPKFKPEKKMLDKISTVLRNEGFERTKFSSVFVFNPDPGVLHLRGWPLESYSKLADSILSDYEKSCVIIIGLDDSKKYAEKISRANPHIFNLCGKTKNIKELLALLAFADFFITNDSGPAHMAALVDIKTIVLFGPESPVRYSPLGENIRSLFAGLACSPCFSAQIIGNPHATIISACKQ